MGMTAPKLIDLPSFNGVAAGSTATLSVPVMGRYHAIRLLYGTATAGGATEANMEAEITEVRLKINGRVQRVFSATELFTINAYRGISVATGIVPILFAEPWRRSALGEDAGAWGMADISTFQIEVDIDSGATTPSLAAQALRQDGQYNMGPIIKWRRFNQPVSATGVIQQSNLPKGDVSRPESYIAIHCFSGDIDDVLVQTDSENQFVATLAEFTELAAEYGWTVQANTFPIDFAYRGRIGDALPMLVGEGNGIRRVQDFRIDFNMSAATGFDLIAEVLGRRD